MKTKIMAFIKINYKLLLIIILLLGSIGGLTAGLIIETKNKNFEKQKRIYSQMTDYFIDRRNLAAHLENYSEFPTPSNYVRTSASETFNFKRKNNHFYISMFVGILTTTTGGGDTREFIFNKQWELVSPFKDMTDFFARNDGPDGYQAFLKSDENYFRIY